MTPICIITFYLSDNKEYVLVTEDRNIHEIMEVVSDHVFHHLFYCSKIRYETSNCIKMNDEKHISIIKLMKELAKERAVKSIEMYESFDISFPSSFLKKIGNNSI